VFDGPGLTQYPTGPHLASIQGSVGGSVILALDVSGSMYGGPLEQAVRGCRRFIDEALDAHYDVGLVLWHHAIAATSPLTNSSKPLQSLLARATAGGGNDIVPTLQHALAALDGRSGDLVVAIFGDGDLGNPARAKEESAKLVARNIRIMTCGLGEASARQLDEISTEERDEARVATEANLPDVLGSMAAGLRAVRRGR
jgi:Mg-chelatase subunit ChlD